MLRVLGFKRILFLIVLITINALLAAAVYMHFAPQNLTKERELNNIRAANNTLRTDIDDMQIAFEQLDEQRDRYQELEKKGFFDRQSRRQAELILQKIQERSGVVSAAASLQAGTFEKSQEAEKADHQILKSPISIRIEAVDDLDVFRYIYLVNEFFPGHVSIEKIEIERESDVSGTVLRAIASGQSPELVKANLQFTWRTMIPIEGNANAAQGGTF